MYWLFSLIVIVGMFVIDFFIDKITYFETIEILAKFLLFSLGLTLLNMFGCIL